MSGPTRRQRKRQQAQLRERLRQGGEYRPVRALRGRTALAVYGGVALWLGASVALVGWLGPTLVDGARRMPGGPAAFAVLLGLGTALALLAAAAGCLLLAGPRRSAGGRRPAPRLVAGTAAAGALALLLLVVLASALPARGSGGPDRCAGREDLGCAVYREDVPALLAGAGTGVLAVCAGSVLLHRRTRRTRRAVAAGDAPTGSG